MNLLEALINAVRLPELRNKILFTGGILIVFRLFANIAIPEANKTALGLLFNQQALLGLLDLFSGGGLSRFSVVAISIVLAAARREPLGDRHWGVTGRGRNKPCFVTRALTPKALLAGRDVVAR